MLITSGDLSACHTNFWTVLRIDYGAATKGWTCHGSNFIPSKGNNIRKRSCALWNLKLCTTHSDKIMLSWSDFLCDQESRSCILCRKKRSKSPPLVHSMRSSLLELTFWGMKSSFIFYFLMSFQRLQKTSELWQFACSTAFSDFENHIWRTDFSRK